MRNRAIFFGAVVLAAIFISAATASASLKHLPMSEFGIRVSAPNLYSAAGRTASGTIVDGAKARLGAGLSQSRKGQRVEVTYMGNGWVEVRNRVTGERVKIEIRESVPGRLPPGP